MNNLEKAKKILYLERKIKLYKQNYLKLKNEFDNILSNSKPYFYKIYIKIYKKYDYEFVDFKELKNYLKFKGLSVILKEMEKNKLIEKSNVIDDKRKVLIRLIK